MALQQVWRLTARPNSRPPQTQLLCRVSICGFIVTAHDAASQLKTVVENLNAVFFNSPHLGLRLTVLIAFNRARSSARKDKRTSR